MSNFTKQTIDPTLVGSAGNLTGEGNAINVRTHLQALLKINVPTGAANGGGKSGVQVGVGRLRSMDAEQEFGTEEVYGVGAYEPNEIVNLKFSGSITLDAFSIRNSDLVTLGLAALAKNILKSSYLEIEVYDPIDKKTIRTYRGVVISRFRETIREGEICGENATCKYMTVE